MKEIIKATQPDFDDAVCLIRNAVKRLDEQGVNQWDDIYPSTEIIRSDIDRGILYKYVKLNKIVGIVSIDTNQPEKYKKIKWKKDGNYLVVHRLAVDPSVQGQGISKIIMNFTEMYATKQNLESIRLDAFQKNIIAVNLYKALKYNIRGEVQFRKGMFYCFEKLLGNMDIPNKRFSP